MLTVHVETVHGLTILVKMLAMFARLSIAQLDFEILLEESVITLPMDVGSSSARVGSIILTGGGAVMAATSAIEEATRKVVLAAAISAVAVGVMISTLIIEGATASHRIIISDLVEHWQ